jgi:hypothetical protein
LPGEAGSLSEIEQVVAKTDGWRGVESPGEHGNIEVSKMPRGFDWKPACCIAVIQADLHSDFANR